MDKKPFTPPALHIDPPSQKTVKMLSQTSKRDQKAFKKSDYFKSCVAPTLERRRKQKRQYFQEWWWSKGIQIVNLILALIAAAASIIALLR